jgi:hypothetical protein
MALSPNTTNKISKLLVGTVREKLKNYKPETSEAPFHYRLLGRDRYAIFSFIQSMNTTFGISIWEQMAVILANSAGYAAEKQYKLLGEIDLKTEKNISQIHYELRKGQVVADKNEEIRQIRKNIKSSQPKRDPDSTVDVFANIKGIENYFDITSAKPNMKEFVALKLKLLRWTALRLSQDRTAKVVTRLAIPYNPYDPDPYERWTLKGLFDLDEGEVLVGASFWNFVAGFDVYDELLELFNAIGKKLRGEIDKRFSEFKNL